MQSESLLGLDAADSGVEQEPDAIRLNVNAVAVAAGLEGNDLHGRIVLGSRSSLEGQRVRHGGTMAEHKLPGRSSWSEPL